jgi:hypothetical protein
MTEKPTLVDRCGRYGSTTTGEPHPQFGSVIASNGGAVQAALQGLKDRGSGSLVGTSPPCEKDSIQTRVG